MLLLMALLQRWQLDMLVHMDRVLMRVPSVKIPVQGQRQQKRKPAKSQQFDRTQARQHHVIGFIRAEEKG